MEGALHFTQNRSVRNAVDSVRTQYKTPDEAFPLNHPQGDKIHHY